MTNRTTNRRRDAKIAAWVAIEQHPEWSDEAILEEIDKGDLAGLAIKTLEDAVNAARKLAEQDANG